MHRAPAASPDQRRLSNCRLEAPLQNWVAPPEGWAVMAWSPVSWATVATTIISSMGVDPEVTGIFRRAIRTPTTGLLARR
jgi:hypothetical protein